MDAMVPPTNLTNSYPINNIVQHQDVCVPGYEAAGPGRCSRAVIAGVGELMVAKLMVTAFIAPTVSLLLTFPTVVRAYERGVQIFRPAYKKSASLDVELAGAIMLMELCMVWGLAVPLVLPLVCVSFASHLAVFHLSVVEHDVEVKYETKPPVWYLIVSVCLGSTLNMWFYIDNATQIEGEYLVYIGVPASLVLGLVLAIMVCTHQLSPPVDMELRSSQPLQPLQETLLGAEDC